MLVWINGPFGGGKTQVGHELVRRLPGAAVCDPEGHAVAHVSLLARPETVRRRLRERAVGRVFNRVVRPGWLPPRETFALANLERCLRALEQPRFAEHLWTDALTVPETAERVAQMCGLPLTDRRGGALRQGVREIAVGVRHIRFD